MESKEPTNEVEINTPQDAPTAQEAESMEAATPAITAEVNEESHSELKNDEHEIPELLTLEDHENPEPEEIPENEHDILEVDDETDENEDYSSLSMDDIVSKVVDMVGADNIAQVKNKVGLLKAQYVKKIMQFKKEHFDKFIAEGGIEDAYESLKLEFEDKYQAAMSLYKDKRGQWLKELEHQKEENLKLKKELLEELRIMINSNEELNKVYNEFKNLQNKWREIGLVPQTEVRGLWDSYNFLVEKFFDKVKINHELMTMGLNKNLEEKIQLCEKTEELLLENSISKSFKLLQEYHEKWKEVGPVPNEKSEEIWERFKNATDKVNKRRHDYYEKLNEEQKSNLILKTALCERIEQLVEESKDGLKEWTESTNAVNALIEEWKTLGPAPKKNNDLIWKRFKAGVNNYYDQKKDFFNKIKDEQMNNYHLKLDLIHQAETLKDSNDWKNTTNVLIGLQNQWKKIGAVPRKHSDKIWKKFRAACDTFFNAKTAHFSTLDTVELENSTKKKALIEALTTQVFTDNKEENLKIIKDYQRQWIEIGRVPFAEKNKLHVSFNKLIDKHLDALNIKSFEFESSAFKSRVDNISDKREAERMLFKEINFNRNRIDELQKEVTLLENNISFFAKSKNADLLIAEVDKKVNKAKKEIELLKAKNRQIDKMAKGLKEGENQA